MHAPQANPATRRFTFLRLVRNERGSNVAQAAAVALLAATLIGALLAVATNLGPSVTQAMGCLAAALGGGGGGCAPGGDAPPQAQAPEQEDEDDGGFWGGVLDVVQVGLDVVGLVPGVGEIADGANGLISLARGDYTGAALSFGAMIPFAGWGATGAKWIRTGVRYSDEAAEVLKYGDEVVQYGDEAAGLADEVGGPVGRNSDDIVPPCATSAPRGKAPGLAAPQAQGGCLVPGTPAHREQRWQEYLERKREAGEEPWSRERWDQQYDINMEQARRANERVNSYHDEIGWGEREVTVTLPDGSVRRLDIADTARQRGIEYKTGYTTRSPDIDYEVARDAELVRQGWDIQWVFEGTPSQPLLRALEEAGIPYVIR